MDELDQYDYELPRELIAQHPFPCRSDARLMTIDRRRETIDSAHVRDLPELLAAGDSLVLNDTRVLPARLVGYRSRTGGRWEGLYLSSDAQGVWRVLCKTRGAMKAGESITLQDGRSCDAVSLRVLARLEDGAWAVRPEAEAPPWELLERVGRVPLPPYIRRGKMIDADREAYQTVYAQRPGAIAAPTAGLHFTQELLNRLEAGGIGLLRITLHVGVGTFRPISVSRLSEHRMHAEWGCIDEATVEQLRRRRSDGGRIIAVGTTVVRVLETAAAGGALRPWRGETELFIQPPHEFAAVDALLTNFHLPRTTLLVLVSALGGGPLIRRAYETAIRERYRFYSYGDAMLIL